MSPAPPDSSSVRAAEVIGALCLATDLGMGFAFEHGLQSTLVASRLGERLGIDRETASQTYYACLLAYCGCTADADTAAQIFGGELTTHFVPVMWGSQRQAMAGLLRALPTPGHPAPVRAIQIARRLPQAARENRPHLAALCEVAQMLTERLGLPPPVQNLFVHLTERWDGRGGLGRARHDEIPLALRIAHVARDAAFQRDLGGAGFAARVVRARGGHAFDPAVAAALADDAARILALSPGGSVWEETLAAEPLPHRVLEGDAIDRALAAMGDFADLLSPHLTGHSTGVASLTTRAARSLGFDRAAVAALRRAALVHDIGRVAVAARTWQKPGPLTPDEWEKVRLHPYQTDRVLNRSPFLAALAPIASSHHERLDGSGYHRGETASTLSAPARLLAAADAFHAMTEPRPHRAVLTPAQAAETLGDDVRSGRLDADAAVAVVEAAGQPPPAVERPAGLTHRELDVIGLLARGMQTKQIASALGISPKTADRHVQNAYAKIGVSTRAAATLFAMQHGLAAWGELPMSRAPGRA
jgi:response regulator RpfG family c-di-GMP phosphodiesterase/DNA-binding CsgD family transcriptional regulator